MSFGGLQKTCIRYRRVKSKFRGKGGKKRTALRCAQFDKPGAVGTSPCSPKGLVAGPWGRSKGLIRPADLQKILQCSPEGTKAIPPKAYVEAIRAALPEAKPTKAAPIHPHFPGGHDVPGLITVISHGPGRHAAHRGPSKKTLRMIKRAEKVASGQIKVKSKSSAREIHMPASGAIHFNNPTSDVRVVETPVGKVVLPAGSAGALPKLTTPWREVAYARKGARNVFYNPETGGFVRRG